MQLNLFCCIVSMHSFQGTFDLLPRPVYNIFMKQLRATRNLHLQKGFLYVSHRKRCGKSRRRIRLHRVTHHHKSGDDQRSHKEEGPESYDGTGLCASGTFHDTRISGGAAVPQGAAFRRIGIVLPPVQSKMQENSFFLEVIKGISSCCNQRSCSVSLVNGSSPEELRSAVRSLFSENAPDGMILLYSHKNDPVTEDLISSGVPFITTLPQQGKPQPISRGLDTQRSAS